jgi:MYXO-CTERM domain-containing protein
MRRAAAFVALGVALVGIASPQHARGANASKPRVLAVWDEAACVEIVDKSQTPVLHLEYTILTEDLGDKTEDEVDDSRTHQFFAFRRQRFLEPPPLWITWDDIERADLVDPMVEPEGIAPEDVLETSPDFAADDWVRITADDMRVPISFAQAMMGVDWDLAAVSPGTWLVRGYTWEPIANKWTTRWGAFKIIDGADAVDDAGPTVILMPHDAVIAAGDDYVPPGCVDAPDGSTLTIEYGVLEGSLEPGWEIVVEDAEVTSGAIDTPVVLPDCANGQIRLRATITDPSGATYVAYSPGSLMAQGTTDVCKEPDEGCSCDVTHGASTWWLVLLAPVLRRRRRSARLLP